MNLHFIITLLLLGGYAFAESPNIEQHLLQKVLQPWVTRNLPDFAYAGKERYCEKPYSWSFIHRDDPHLKTTFPLDIEMEFCRAEVTARNYMHANDWSLAGIPNTGKVPSHIGDESEVFDIRETSSGRLHGRGGWVYCRVGTCLFFIRSYSVTIDAMKGLAAKIAEAVPRLPDPPEGIRDRGEQTFRQAITESKKQEEEFKRTPPEDRLSYPLGAPSPKEGKP